MARGISPEDFDFKSVRSNILILKKLKPNQRLYADKRGKLFVDCGKLKSIFFKKRINDAILCTAYSFLYTMRTPYDRKSLFKLLERKKEIMETILLNLSLNQIKESVLIEIRRELRSFVTSLYLHLRIYAKIRMAITRCKENSLVKRVKKALPFGVMPIKSVRGYSGTYIMRDRDYKKVGVFKPFDEEIGGPNNPSGVKFKGPLGKDEIRPGVRVGECLHREVVAYKVSEALNLKNVPKTTYAKFPAEYLMTLEKKLSKYRMEKEKIGSFQEFMEGYLPLHKFSKSEIAHIDLFEIQKLFILDLVIGHLDRHFSNILYNGKKIIAIDNGLSFSEKIQAFKAWHWLKLPQLKEPLLKESKAIIENASLLHCFRKRCYLSPLTMERMNERIELLQDGCKRGLTPFEIANLYTPEALLCLKG